MGTNRVKRADVIGHAVFELKDGREVARVCDLVVDWDQRRVTGLVVESGGIWPKRSFLPLADVRSMGDDIVTCRDASVIKPLGSHQQVAELVKKQEEIFGQRILTEEGDDIGVLADVFFDVRTGQVTGYEVSGGLLEDVMEGKDTLPPQVVIQPGQDAVILRAPRLEGP